MSERSLKLDYQLADLLHGDHPIDGDHEERVVRIAELIALFDAVQTAGNHRHTNDWDWGATITMSDGEKVSDAWAIEFAEKPENFVACVQSDKVTHIRVEGQTWTGGDEPQDLNRDLCINQITNIYWEWR